MELLQPTGAVPADSITLVVLSRPLILGIASYDGYMDPVEWGGDGSPSPAALIDDMARTLASTAPGLLAAVRDSMWHPATMKLVIRELTSANERGTTPERRDLLILAADAALSQFFSEDSMEVRTARRELGPFGAEIGAFTLGGGFGYCGSLLRALSARAGTTRWADWGFARMQAHGWETDCACGSGGYELFRPVIRNGEAFLRSHPDSPAATAIAQTVARAHETAWSLGQASPEDEYADASRYRADAPEHRQRAIEGYRRLLLSIREPAERRRIQLRLRRMELGIDTGSRTFMHFCD